MAEYTCPVCGTNDPEGYQRCWRPDCTDGRDPRPRPSASPEAALAAASELSQNAYRAFLALYNEQLAATAGAGSALIRGAALVDALLRVAAVAAVDVVLPPAVAVATLQEALTAAAARAPRFS